MSLYAISMEFNPLDLDQENIVLIKITKIKQNKTIYVHSVCTQGSFECQIQHNDALCYLQRNPIYGYLS